MKNLTFIIFLMVFLKANVFGQELTLPAHKIGVYYFEFQGANFNLTNKSSSASKTASEYLIGSAFFYEYILYDVVSIGVKYGSGLVRELNADVGSADILVTEATSFWLLNFKSYTSNHFKKGLKGYFTVGYGSMGISSTITTSPSSEESTSATIPLAAWGLGLDYTIGIFGFRMELGRSSGKRVDLESSTTYYATYDYSATTAAAALYFFF